MHYNIVEDINNVYKKNSLKKCLLCSVKKKLINLEKVFYFNHSGIHVLLKTNVYYRNNLKTLFIKNII